MLPYKANKSLATEYFRKGYSQLSLITEYPPPHWAPLTAILEGMSTLPMVGMSCMREYNELLVENYIRPHFQEGAEEVRVVFDTPGSMPETPKDLEKKQRDKNADKGENQEAMVSWIKEYKAKVDWTTF